MDERPRTSKPRGICQYYTSSGGCRNGDTCKFLHGDNETLSPYDRSKTCKFYSAGFCKRSDKCWFRHINVIDEEFGAVNEDEDGAAICSICQEKPVCYGLLEECSHVFCLECIRGWRDPSGKSQDIVTSGNTKRCPYCRTPSKFVTPSSIFYPSEDPCKTLAIASYKASMKRIPCKYFGGSRPGSRFCPFGKDCFYQHKEPDGTEFVFEHGADYYMLKRSRRRTRRADAGLVELLASLQQYRLDLDMLPVAVELRPDLRGRFEAAFSRIRRNPRVAGSSAGYNFRADIEERLESSDTTASEDDHIEEAQADSSRPSILATPDDNVTTSALPLTRGFMDRNIPSEFVDYLTDVPGSEDGDYNHHRETETPMRPRLAQFRRYSLPDLASVLDYGGPDNIAETEEPDGTDTADSEQSSLDLSTFTHADVAPEDSGSNDSTMSNNAIFPSLSTLRTCSVQSLSPNEPTNDQESLMDERPSSSAAISISPGGENRTQDNESRRKPEARNDLTSRRAKSSNSVPSCSGRRNGGQSFVTDGRGRVVATDDLAYTDSASLAFWGNAVSAAVPQSDTASETNEQTSAGLGPLDDLD